MQEVKYLRLNKSVSTDAWIPVAEARSVWCVRSSRLFESLKKVIKPASGLYQFHWLPPASRWESKSQKIKVFFLPHIPLCLLTSAALLRVQTDVKVGLCQRKFLYYWRELCGWRTERLQFPRLGTALFFFPVLHAIKDLSPYLGFLDSLHRNTNLYT